MATVIRPPFWVPRPSDDPVLTLASINMLGVNGTIQLQPKPSPLEVLSPVWVPRPGDEPPWVGSPVDSALLHPLLTAGGQIQPKRYSPYPIDDPLVWSGSPLSSDILVPILTAGGKIKQPVFRSYYTLDDASHWLIPQSQGPPQTLTLPAASPLEAQSPFYVARPSDDPHWLIASPQQIPQTLLITPTPVTPERVRFYGYDDPSVWNGVPLASDILVPILTAGGQPPQRKYSAFVVDDQPVWWGSPLNSDALYMLVEKGAPFHRAWLPWETLDDPAVWTGSPLHSSTVPFFTVGGQPPTKVYAFFPADDAAAWWGSPLNSDALFMLVEKGKPFFKSWSFNVNDDPAVWTGSPLHSSTVPFFTIGGQPPTKVYSFFPSDDPPSWQQTAYRNLGMALITPEPYIPLLARFVSYDDPAFWQGNPLHSWIIPELTQQTPIVPLISRFVSNDDAAVWTGSPLRSDTISALTAGGQPPELIFRYGSYDDAAFWQQTTYRNQIALVPGPAPLVPLISRFASYDDPAFWYAAPVASNTLPILIRGGAPAVPLLDRFASYDDAAVWLASPVASETLPLLIRGGAPAVPLVSRFVSYDDPAFWQATIYRDLALLIPPTPVTPRFWRFGQDDATIWMGHPYISNVILDLTAGGKPFSVMYQSGAVQGNYDTAETAWQFETPFNVSLTTALPHPPFNNQAAFFNQGMAFATDDAAFWVWVPPRSWAMIMPAPPVTVVPPQHPTPYNATVNFGKMGSG